MTEHKIPIPGRIYNASGGNVCGTDDVIDDVKGKKQSQINTEVDNAIQNEIERATQAESDRYTKSEVYKKEETYNKNELNNLITTPEVNYVNVEATDQTTSISDVLPATGAANTIYKIGSWDGSQYDASKYSEYTWNDSAYVYLATRDHGVDDEPTDGSNNLVKSGGVAKNIDLIKYYLNEDYFLSLKDAGKYIQGGTGRLIDDASRNWLTSDFIEILSVEQSLSFDYAFVGNGINGISFYSEENENTYITGRAGNTDTALIVGSVSIPSNAKYVRFCTKRVTDLLGQCFFNPNIKSGIYKETAELGFRDNLLNQVTQGGYINNNGEIVSDSNWKHSDYISVTPNTILCGILIGFGTNAVSVIEFSDANHTILSNETVNSLQNYISSYGIGSDVVLTIAKKIPNGASYIRICINVSLSAYEGYQCLYIKTCGLGTAIEQLPKINSNVEQLKSELQITDANIWKYTGKYINLSGGLSSHTDFMYTDFLSVELFKNAIKSSISLYSIAYTYEVAYYATTDESTFISGQGNGNGYITELNIPENAKFVRFCKDINRTNQYIDIIPKIQENINDLHKEVSDIKQDIGTNRIINLVGKKIFLYGDSISSTDYIWYKEYMEKYSGATVYNQGLSGGSISQLAANDYFARLATINPDIVICLLGGNDSGGLGTVGTFSENSILHEMGEDVVTETDITQDYDGTKFIQGVSHIIRKWKSIYFDFRLSANLSAKLVAASDVDTPIYTGTEKECIEYAQANNINYGTGKDYYILCTETSAEKRIKLMSVPHPKLILLTTLKQQRFNSAVISSPESWERKRLAVIECCEKYDMPFIDTMRLFNIDMAQEPVYPGMNKTSTDVNDNQGVYTMDGLHPNEFGYEYLSRIILNNINI